MCVDFRYGAEVTTMEGLQEAMHLFEPKHFLMPFPAHALGTFLGALLAAKIAANHKMKFALAIGCIFLVGGDHQRYSVTLTGVVHTYRPCTGLHSNGLFGREVGSGGVIVTKYFEDFIAIKNSVCLLYKHL
jgi:hypothetical protein